MQIRNYHHKVIISIPSRFFPLQKQDCGFQKKTIEVKVPCKLQSSMQMMVALSILCYLIVSVIMIITSHLQNSPAQTVFSFHCSGWQAKGGKNGKKSPKMGWDRCKFVPPVFTCISNVIVGSFDGLSASVSPC
jgi:hypothetical protein